MSNLRKIGLVVSTAGLGTIDDIARLTRSSAAERCLAGIYVDPFTVQRLGIEALREALGITEGRPLKIFVGFNAPEDSHENPAALSALSTITDRLKAHAILLTIPPRAVWWRKAMEEMAARFDLRSTAANPLLYRRSQNDVRLFIPFGNRDTRSARPIVTRVWPETVPRDPASDVRDIVVTDAARYLQDGPRYGFVILAAGAITYENAAQHADILAACHARLAAR